MKTLEKLLLQAKKEENIVIDESFKQILKKKIISSRPIRKEILHPNTNIWWKRLVIVFVPLSVTLVMFFYYSQGDTQQTIKTPSTQGTVQSEKQEKQSASVFSNRSMESAPTVLSAPPSPPGLSDNTRTSTSLDTEDAFGVSHPNSSSKDIKTSSMSQNIDISFMLLGGVVLLALFVSLLFWYLTKRKR
jgi:hypothetical protein